ncbi:hypothetical protein Tco_1231629 [Tanacetum coccineum]
MNEDAEDEITCQQNDQHTEDAINVSTSSSTEMNEEKEDEMPTARVQPNAIQGQPETQNEPAGDLLALGTDISKITRKQSKTGKHGHENQKSTKRSQRIKAEARKVKPQSNPVKMVKHWSTKVNQ